MRGLVLRRVGLDACPWQRRLPSGVVTPTANQGCAGRPHAAALVLAERMVGLAGGRVLQLTVCAREGLSISHALQRRICCRAVARTCRRVAARRCTALRAAAGVTVSSRSGGRCPMHGCERCCLDSACGTGRCAATPSTAACARQGAI